MRMDNNVSQSPPPAEFPSGLMPMAQPDHMMMAARSPPMQPSPMLYRADVMCSINLTRPDSRNIDQESQMRVYEELEREASARQEKQDQQFSLITKHTKQMKEDLSGSEEVMEANRGHLKDIEAFEREVKLRLRSKLLTDRQVEDLRGLQMATLVELRAIVNLSGHSLSTQNSMI